MAKRFNKLTPIATSVALSLGLTGCFGDDDNNTQVVNPPKPIEVESSVTVDFSTSISGRAVKGTLKNAQVQVKTIDANGEFTDLAYRVETGSVEEKATATTEEEAKKLASKAILDANPALVTGEKGEYTIFVDSEFSGPVYITVATKKEGDDSLIKCDAFVGCGAFSATSDLDVNKNNKVDFGEWYKDDLELSVVKLIKSASTQASSVKGKQFAEGDEASSFKANLTLFTSAASAILTAGNGEINSEAISSASKSVITALIGDEALLASLSSDLSEGGAVDFTDVDGTEALDAGVLTMIQVAASIQAVAAKGGNGTISDVIQKLKNDVKDNTLGTSDTFKELKAQSKTAGKILAAVVSGDTQAVKDALVEAGVDEATAEQTATAAKDAKDKAVSSGATTDKDLKEDVDESKKQLDEIGDGEALENAKLAELLTEQLAELKVELSAVQASITALQEQQVTVVALGDKADKSNQEVIDYAVAATEFKEAVDNNTDSTTLARLNTSIEQLITSSNDLVSKDDQYQAIADDAVAQKSAIDSEISKISQLTEIAKVEFDESSEAVEAIGQKVEAAKAIAESAVENAVQAKLALENSEQSYQDAISALEVAIAQIQSESDVDEAFALLNTASNANNNVVEVANSYDASAKNAFVKATEYASAALSTDFESDSIALKATAEGYEADASNALELAEANRVTRQNILDAHVVTLEKARLAEIAKVGTDKMVGVSFVTKQGAGAIYDLGDLMLEVVEDIVNNGSFDSGQQSGSSAKYPDWSYSYNLDIDNKDLTFVFENATDGQKVELLGTVTSGFRTSTIVFTWSGNLNTESGQRLVMPEASESLEQCVFFAEGDSRFTNNASCLYINLNKDIAVNNPDYSDLEVLNVKSFNIVEITDGQYGFDGTVEFDIYGLDENGDPKGLFSSGDVIEYADFTINGITEQTEFSVVFDVKFDDIHRDIGTVDVNLLNYHGYQFRLDLVSEVGPLFGEVSLYNDVEGKKAVAGAVREITNGFNINYVNGQSIDYTNIDFLGESN